MKRTPGACLVLAVVGGACGVGEDEILEPIDPNPNRVACSVGLKTQGTFSPGVPGRPIVPADPDDPEDVARPLAGCWPVGTWTFTATIDPAAEVLDIDGDGVGDRCGEVPGTALPQLAPSYSYRVDRVMDDVEALGWTETITVLTGTTESRLVRMKISEGGGGECEGGMEYDNPERTALYSLKPALEGTTLTGFGEYTLYLDPQR